MGRTLPTFNTWLQEEIDSWKEFRRGLRAEQRPAFDRLFVRARRHTAEATCAARPIPFDALVMAILLEQEMELERLSAEVESLREERAP
ncbi:hypothetical protein GC173_07895 [bacterium]|nr:hypothetical protein [bacterium]